jgi:hypothetical protein
MLSAMRYAILPILAVISVANPDIAVAQIVAAPESGATAVDANQQRARGAMDAQQGKWDADAKRANNSMCSGCTSAPLKPGRTEGAKRKKRS